MERRPRLALSQAGRTGGAAMNITAYFDESGSHADAPVTAMAGYVADERQWQHFNARVGKLFAQFGVRTFHLVDLRHSDGDFAGWSVDRKIEFSDELQHIANESLESGVTAFLSEENYQKHYCALDWPRRARKDTKYCILFRACMGITVESVLGTPRWAYDEDEPQLRVVLEDGHNHAKDLRRFYEATIRQFDGLSRALAGLSFANKDCLPIAAADLIAGAALTRETGRKPIGFAKHPTKAEISYRGNLWRVSVEPEQLLGLYHQAVGNVGAHGPPVPLRRS